MKALTLTQPWAQLMAVGAKTIETRNWTTNHRGWLAIHAGKGLGPVGGKAGLLELCSTEPFQSTLMAAGFSQDMRLIDAGAPDPVVNPLILPFGWIVAVAWLEDCVPTESHALEVDMTERGIEHEVAFGDYSPGRFAWLFSKVLAIEPMLEAKGHQGIWDLDYKTAARLGGRDYQVYPPAPCPKCGGTGVVGTMVGNDPQTADTTGCRACGEDGILLPPSRRGYRS